MSVLNSGGTIGDASPAADAFPANHKFYHAKFLEALQPAERDRDWETDMFIPRLDY